MHDSRNTTRDAGDGMLKKFQKEFNHFASWQCAKQIDAQWKDQWEKMQQPIDYWEALPEAEQQRIRNELMKPL
jgi:hypothetical protein